MVDGYRSEKTEGGEEKKKVANWSYRLKRLKGGIRNNGLPCFNYTVPIYFIDYNANYPQVIHLGAFDVSRISDYDVLMGIRNNYNLTPIRYVFK